MSASAIPSYKTDNRRDDGRAAQFTDLQASDNLFDHSGQRTDGMRLRITVPAERAQTTAAINKYDWQQSLTFSRQLYARVPEVNGALLQKALYTVGDAWCPEYLGKNEAWGQQAREMLEAWFNVCDLRGEPFDFQTDLFITAISQDRCGDQAMVLTRDSDGEPRLQFKPAHCITTRYGEWGVDQTGYGTVPSGRYKGLRSYNGVIFDQRSKAVAYNFLGDTPDKDRQISTVSAQLLYEPDWADQGRGIPRLATSLLSWMNYEDISYFLKRQVKQDSAQGLLHYNENGSADTTRDYIQNRPAGTATNNDVKIEQLEGNEIMYFKAMGGGKLEPYRTERPHPNVDAYCMRIIRGCLQSSGWFYELYDPAAIGGASTRLIQDMARMSVWWRQRTLRKRAYRAILFALSVWMEMGVLPPNDTDWHMWKFTLPAEITVDARNDDKSWMERIKMAAGTYADYFGERGAGAWQDVFRQRIREEKFLQEECASEGVDINRVQLLTPNAQNTEDEEEQPKEKKKKK